jgi:hypothetical protein
VSNTLEHTLYSVIYAIIYSKSQMIRLFCYPKLRAKFTNQNINAPEKSEMIEEILCQARKRVRSILGVCEKLAIRRLVQIYQSELSCTKNRK